MIDRVLKRKRPYYKTHPDVPHQIVFTIDEIRLLYDVPGDGTGGWKDIVKAVNEIDAKIENGEIDTRVEPE